MKTSSTSPEYDLIVVGGGPSGSTLATLVAMRGGRVLLLEKEKFPRYQIGESLLPATVHGIGKLLGVREELDRAGFVQKLGGTFRWGSNRLPWEFAFASSDHFAGSSAYAYQVERMKFDQILLDNAKKKGVEVREQCAVSGVVEEGERVRGLRYTDADGTAREVTAHYVADASGNTSRIHRHIGGERKYSEYFRNVAVFGYFEGGDRLPGPKSGNIFCPTFDDGWFWYIPLSDTLTSVGAVVHRDAARRIQGDPAGALAQFISECPPIQEKLAAATRVTEGPYGQVRVRKDYSYHQTRFWRPGMLLVGDAACFVDPVLSSGVHLATYGALVAARTINSVLTDGITEEVAFTEYEQRYRAEYGRFYEYLIAFYNMNAEADSYFWAAKKVTNTNASELAAFAELVGGGSSQELALTQADTLHAHFDEATRELEGAVRDSGSLHGSPMVRRAMREGAGIQIQVALGRRPGREKPLTPGGLVPTADGLSWTPAPPGGTEQLRSA